MHAPEIDGMVYVNDFGPFASLVPGRFYRCEVTEAHDYDWVARVASASVIEPTPEQAEPVLAGAGAAL
jgi:ribosomal protein S12 methylthiotransferase